MEARAVARHIRVSPYKVRRIANLVRGKVVSDALNILHFSDIGASKPLEKAVRSAVANFLNDEKAAKISPEDLVLKELRIDGAGMLKRFRAGSMGRATPIRKRSCHITVVVSDDKN
ncbi:50S ribosomal protein L22 [candidate division KSB1 bacterium]|nr:50S ribosomal protein L22 [candidate division KSB1 bacterium]